MKIRIDEHGALEKGGREQYCPFAVPGGDGISPRCGTWCPHFGEPEAELEQNDDKSWSATGDVSLRLCSGTILTGEIIDERGKA